MKKKLLLCIMTCAVMLGGCGVSESLQQGMQDAMNDSSSQSDEVSSEKQTDGLTSTEISTEVIITETELTDTEVSALNATEAESINTELTEEVKSVILEQDSIIWDALSSIDAAYASFVETLNSSPTDLDLYDAAKDLHTSGFNAWSSIGSAKYEGIDEYKDAAQSYALTIQLIGEDVQKYIDQTEVKYLSEAKEYIENKDTFALQVVTARMKFLSTAGFSDDEISSILSSEE